MTLAIIDILLIKMLLPGRSSSTNLRATSLRVDSSEGIIVASFCEHHGSFVKEGDVIET